MAEYHAQLGRLTKEEQRRNAESRDAWERFGPHRQRVTSLLLDRPAAHYPNASLCLLGAGNLNDVDLRQLLAHYAVIQPVDLDGLAMQLGVERQCGTCPPSIQICESFDLTGVWPRLEAFAEQTVASAALDAVLAELVQHTRAAHIPLPRAPFDVVVSLATLSQLFDAVQRIVGNPTTSWPLIQAIRSRHLQLLLETTQPGGTALLVFEIVSSKTCPALPSTSLAELPALLKQLVDQNNFFTGLNPSAIAHELASNHYLRSLIATVQFETPWLWDLGPRVYAVTALRLTRSSTLPATQRALQ